MYLCFITGLSNNSNRKSKAKSSLSFGFGMHYRLAFYIFLLYQMQHFLKTWKENIPLWQKERGRVQNFFSKMNEFMLLSNLERLLLGE